MIIREDSQIDFFSRKASFGLLRGGGGGGVAVERFKKSVNRFLIEQIFEI